MLENGHINTTYQKLWDVTKVTLGKFIYVYMFVCVCVYTHYKNRNHDISIQFKL